MFKILIIPSCPLEEEPLEIKKELRFLEDALAGKLHIKTTVVPPIYEKISSRLAREEFHAIYYTGHGTSSGNLVLEDSNMERREITPEQFCKCLREGKPVKLAFMMCCHSQAVCEKIEKCNVPYIVGIEGKYKILDKVASNFSLHFFELLSNGKTFSHAFERAKEIVSQKEDGYQKEARRIMRWPAVDQPQSERPLISQSQNTLFPPSNIKYDLEPKLIGARENLKVLHKALSTSHLISFHGDAGFGKKSTVSSLAQRYLTRNEFPGGIYWINLETIEDENTFLSTLARTCNINLRGGRESGGMKDFEEILHKLSQTRQLLILNNPTELLKSSDKDHFTKYLQRLSSQENLYFIVIHNDPLLMAEANPIKIHPLNNEATLELFLSFSPESVDQDQIKEEETKKDLCNYFGGDPTLVQLAAIKHFRHGQKHWEKLGDLAKELKANLHKDSEERKIAVLQWAWEELSKNRPDLHGLWCLLAQMPGGLSLNFLSDFMGFSASDLEYLEDRRLLVKDMARVEVIEVVRTILSKWIESTEIKSHQILLEKFQENYPTYLSQVDLRAANNLSGAREIMIQEMPNWNTAIESVSAEAKEKGGWNKDLLKKYRLLLQSTQEFFKLSSLSHGYPEHCENLKKWAEELGDQETLSVVLELLAHHLKWVDLLPEAYALYQKTFEIYQGLPQKDLKGMAECQLNMAQIEIWGKVDYPEGSPQRRLKEAETYIKDLLLQRPEQEKILLERQLELQRDSARLIAREGKYEEALGDYMELFSKQRRRENWREEVVIYNHLARLYSMWGKLHLASEHADEAYKRGLKIGSKWGPCLSLEIQACVFFRLEQYHPALACFQLAANYRVKHKMDPLGSKDEEGPICIEGQKKAQEAGIDLQEYARKSDSALHEIRQAGMDELKGSAV